MKALLFAADERHAPIAPSRYDLIAKHLQSRQQGIQIEIGLISQIERNVMENGSVPLDVLEELVNDYIARTRAAAT